MGLFRVVLITTPSGTQAKKVAQEIVQGRLGACVNIVPHVRSIYRWEGKINDDRESLLIVKTKKSCLKKLISRVKKIHPYSVPEIISLPILEGNAPYLNWIKKETQP